METGKEPPYTHVLKRLLAALHGVEQLAAAPVDAAPPIGQGRVSAFCRIGVETKRADAPRLSERLDEPGAGFDDHQASA